MRTQFKNDLLNYDLYVLVNDGINFAEWEYIGTYNQSVDFEGTDGYKYRFKSVSRDIYGNVEKNGYDYELRIDTTRPQSFFKGMGSNYYFTSNEEVLLDWEMDNDIFTYNIQVFYTNFTTDYLDAESVVWTAMKIILIKILKHISWAVLAIMHSKLFL